MGDDGKKRKREKESRIVVMIVGEVIEEGEGKSKQRGKRKERGRINRKTRWR